MIKQILHSAMLGSALVLLTPAAMASERSSRSNSAITDAQGDASPRPTDAGGGGVFDPAAAPDLLSAHLSAWSPTDPASDPYTGAEIDPSLAHIFRIDLVFDQVVNPPGPLGLGMGAFNPLQFGDRPLYGFFEIDVDKKSNSGGELEPVANSRFLANVARFGGLPKSSFGERAAQSTADYDGDYFAGPQFERSGAEFTLILCGCFEPTVVSEDGDQNGKFNAGETWLVEGRFFERMTAIRQWSGVGGGSDLGLYDPVVRLRFAHDIPTDQTTVSLVYALDMTGAAQLAGEPVQFSDFDVANHTSIEEALDDLIETAEGAGGPIQNPAVVDLVDQWRGNNTVDFLTPTEWDVNAIFGTAYTSPASSLYVWSDVGFEATRGDFTTDSLVNALDRAALTTKIALLDGTASDADGIVNGSVAITGHPANFSLFDLAYDGVIDQGDVDLLDAITPLAGDINGDCIVDTADLGALIAQFGTAGAADLNNDDVVDTADLGLLISAFGQTCN